MKTTIIAVITAIFAALSATAQVAPEVKPPAAEKPAVASIVGSWKVKEYDIVWTFTPENKMSASTGSSADWKSTGESKYEVEWTKGSPCPVTIEPTGKTLTLLRNGRTYSAERIADQALVTSAADPIVGGWRSGKGALWTFRSDGSASSSAGKRGIWKLIKSPTSERKYELHLNKGGEVIAGEMDRNHRKMDFTGDFKLERIEDSKDK
jgi:hypothetical protein